MHDSKVIAHEIRRPWPSRSPFRAADPGIRWRIRHRHDHFEDELHPGMCDGCDQPMTSTTQWFPWYKPGSYSAFWRLAGRDFYWPPMITIWHNEPGGRDALSTCRDRRQRPDGTWYLTRGWKWHLTHFSLQFPPLQHLRRTLLTRCAWCGGRSRKGDVVNCSAQWGAPRGRWWQGEPGLFHEGCLGRQLDYGICTCYLPQLSGRNRQGYGECGGCGKYRPLNVSPERLARARLVQAQPRGTR